MMMIRLPQTRGRAEERGARKIAIRCEDRMFDLWGECCKLIDKRPNLQSEMRCDKEQKNPTGT